MKRGSGFKTWSVVMVLLVVWVSAGRAEEQKRGLGLSEEQRAALMKLHSKYEDQREDLKLQMQELRLKLARMVRAKELDKEAIKEKLHEILQVEESIQNSVVDEIFEAKEILTPEQFLAYKRKILQRMMGRKSKGRGRWQR